MRRVDVPVEVDLERGRPCRFRWRGRSYRVQRVIGRWRYMGRWWAGEGERLFYKVQTADRGLFELYCELESGRWRLYRIYD